MRTTYRRWLALALLLAVLTMAQITCGNVKSKGSVDFYEIKNLSLSEPEKDAALKLARACLAGAAKPGKTEITQRLYRKDRRGAFVSVARTDKTALTGFALGDTIDQAIQNAAADLKRITKGEPLDAYRVRVDIVESSTKPITQTLGEKWKKIDISLHGVILNSDPPLALLPQELRDRAILDYHRKFSAKRFKSALKLRGVPAELSTRLLDQKTVEYARIKVISFMEDSDRNRVDLMRMNRTSGYEPTEQNLRHSIDAAGRYLAQAVREDGSYEYHYHPQTDSLSRSYNELRHAGTTFSMMQIYEVNRDPKVLAAGKNALEWLVRNSRGPSQADSRSMDWKALNDSQLQYAKLGGSGLSLLAFGWYTLVTGDLQYVPLMQDYARFVEYMVQENGDVKMRYWYREKDKNRQVQPVLYYPGEAFFGLATLYKIDKNPRWIEVASRGIDYIVDVRDKLKPNMALPHDHWMAYSINHVHMVEPKDSHVKHAWRLFDAMDRKFLYEHKDSDMVGGYFKEPVSVRGGCRLEATTAFYRLAERLGDPEKMDQFLEILKTGATFLMRTQYDDFNTMFFENPKKPQGAMMRSYWEPSTQIDYTQHSVSALIELYNILRERAKKAERPITQKLPEPNP